MPMFIKDKRYVLFLHVPKTGGTSIERLFQASGWKVHLRDGRTGPGTANFARRCSSQHMQAALLQEILDLKRFELVFMVVRDPIARFRSEYAMRLRDPEGVAETAVDAWAEKMFRRYRRNPYVLDNHLRPQADFLLPGSRVHRLEDGLEPMVRSLDEEFGLGLEGELGREQHSQDRVGVSSRDVRISDALEARLRETYAADFSEFGYA